MQSKQQYFNKGGITLDSYPIPSSEDIELQIIADAVNVPEGFEDYRKIIKEDDFSDLDNRRVWKSLCEKYDRGEQLSLVTLNSIVGNQYLTLVIDKPSCTEITALSHCHSLSNISRRRLIYTNSLELLKAASQNCLDADQERDILEVLNQSVGEKGANSTWKDVVFDYNSSIPQPQPVLSCNGVPIATKDNITVISGRPKVCKTTFQSAIVAACLSGKRILNIEPTSPFFKLLVCDTEQSPFYLSAQCDRAFRMAEMAKGEVDGAFIVLNLRPYAPKDRCDLIEAAVEDYRPDIVFIDGGADLVEDTNDLKASEELVTNLLKLSSKFSLALVTIVHSNPGGEGKVRGHLGSCLERKAETILVLEKEGDTIKVRPRQTRNKPFEYFTFQLCESGDPELIVFGDKPTTAEDWLMYSMAPHKEYRNTELVEMLSEKGFSKSTAQYALKESVHKGRIVKDENLYSLRLQENNSTQYDMPDI